ncbi:MAG: hypothetical protein LBL59_05370 [Xanthomonadaceae bacterium]|jgi:hypothetical protein|nr:hypothetical protein [Xanthomonadaceae bacterium]
MSRFSLILAAALSTCSAAAAAGPLVDVALVDRDNGQWLPQYPHRGDTWVAGTPGHRYSVRLSNTTGQRVLVVLSVDGVNAVSGQTASASQTGYVLGPWETAEISGWRKSLSEIAQFVFTDKGDSYAARTGRAANVGVIGVAVFQERPPYRPRQIIAPEMARSERRRDASPATGMSAEPSTPAADSIDEEVSSAKSYSNASRAQQQIGTGHGAREWSPVGQTDFRRASNAPAQITEVRYDTARRLTALGIIPRPGRPDYHDVRPSAFPNGFVADPPYR